MTKIEKAAVRAVEEYLDSCPRLNSFLKDNDKTPFWDGDVFVYKTNSLTNDNFYGRVPVQVRGRKSSTSYILVKRKEAEAFRTDRGCLFFKALIQNNPSAYMEDLGDAIYNISLLMTKGFRLRKNTKQVVKESLVIYKKIAEAYPHRCNINIKLIELLVDKYA